MARLQILELPTVYREDGVEETPFVLVIDQVDDEAAADIAHWPNDISKRLGARHVICFPGTIDIPANESAPPTDARYEMTIGGQPIAWTKADENLAQIAEQAQGLGQERTGIARDADRLTKRKNEITDALGVDRLRDWDDIRNAAAGLRHARDGMRDAIQRVRDLSEEPEVMNSQQPDAAAFLQGYGVAIRAAKRATAEQ